MVIYVAMFWFQLMFVDCTSYFIQRSIRFLWEDIKHHPFCRILSDLGEDLNYTSLNFARLTGIHLVVSSNTWYI